MTADRIGAHAGSPPDDRLPGPQKAVGDQQQGSSTHAWDSVMESTTRARIVIHRGFSAWHLAVTVRHPADGVRHELVASAQARWIAQGWRPGCIAVAVLVHRVAPIDPYRPPQPGPWVAIPHGGSNPSCADCLRSVTTSPIRAISQLGKPYVWGGADLTGFDCSGLVRFIYDQVGIAVPRTAAEQFSAAKPVSSLKVLKPGDLLFFRTQQGEADFACRDLYGRRALRPCAAQPARWWNSASSTMSTTGRG